MNEIDVEKIKLTDIDKIVLLDVTQCVKATWNYKNEDEELSEKLLNNLKRNGQIENILVRLLPTGFYEVVNGNHRLEALIKLGAKKVIAYDLGDISTEEAKRIAIETNETKFQTDAIKLSQLINELSDKYSLDELIQTMPFNEQELNNFLEMYTHSLEDIVADNSNSDEVGAGSKSINEIHIKLNDSAAKMWNEFREIAKNETDNNDVSDYTAFILAVECATKYITEERKFFGKD